MIARSAIKDLNAFLALAKDTTHIHHIIKNSTIDGITYNGSVAANSTRLEQVAGQQWVALGDAAISFDPLSSQGMFNAMASALQLQKLLVTSGIISNPDVVQHKQFQETYTQQIDAIWKQYLYHKKLFYKAETRWASHPFWERRF